MIVINRHCSIVSIKKKIFIIGLLMVAGCSDAKQQAVFPKVEKKLNAQHKIKVDGCQISYNNKPIDFNASLTEWLNVFGSNYRKVERTKHARMGQVEVMSGSTLSTDLAAMPKLQMDYDELFVLRNKAGKAMPNMKYKIKTEDGKMIEGMTDAEGKTEKVTSLSMTKAVITLLGYVDE